MLVQAPSLLSRYVGDTADPFVAYEGSRWFPTGDLEDVETIPGRLWITGRLKLLIDVGGVKVNPLEIESVLERHEAVGRCVVLPVPVSETVSRVKAIITPRFAGRPSISMRSVSSPVTGLRATRSSHRGAKPATHADGQGRSVATCHRNGDRMTAMANRVAGRILMLVALLSGCVTRLPTHRWSDAETAAFLRRHGGGRTRSRRSHRRRRFTSSGDGYTVSLDGALAADRTVAHSRWDLATPCLT